MGGRRSVQAGIYSNVFVAAQQITAAAGTRGLFTGYLPTLLEDIPDMAFKFAAYESLRSARLRLMRGRKATVQARTRNLPTTPSQHQVVRGSLIWLNHNPGRPARQRLGTAMPIWKACLNKAFVSSTCVSNLCASCLKIIQMICSRACHSRS